MPQPLRRFQAHLERSQDEQRLARILLETGLTAPAYQRPPADNRTLRGIPAVGPGVSGHIPGTHPLDVIRRTC